MNECPKMSESAKIDAEKPPRLSSEKTALVLFFLLVGCFFQGTTYSQLTAFFNKYALIEKGLSSSQYGIIMGSYCFVIIFVTPMAAKLVTMRRFMDKTILFFGWVLDATFCMIMASVSKAASGYPFFAASLCLRLLEAIGCAIGFFMLYIIVGAELSEINYIIIPIIETVYGVSVVIGPAISGVLYDYGGFSLPFLTLGGTLLGLTILALVIFPKPRPVLPDAANEKPPSMWSAVQGPIIVNVICSLNTFILISFNESTLALRLNEAFGMTASESGFAFLYAGGLYAFSSLLLGYLSQRVADPRFLVLFGQVLIIVSLIIQVPLIPSEQTRQKVYLAQILFGLGTGPTFVCSYLHSLKYLANGAETKETYAVLSAIFAPMTALGGTLGPLIAGVILDFYSYETVVAVNTVQTVIVMICLVVAIIVTRSSASPKTPPV
ncbi:hypothetical protein BIW11_01781 [Tropilaelaps mercedesae]|uniref:Major facilitator superfamily (MFS) profile domain-containing protein n=1 Tax=Tropilaelaps mercedesae TaxID=418985 RepID=A0A1V9X8T4_9ACAR|nr:hypothetical protein BIW11_01781 [Tropilaelaps mercedesae]